MGPHERRLNHLMFKFSEETGELIQEIGKAGSYGIEGYHPVTGVSNSRRIIEEFADVRAVFEMIRELGHLAVSEEELKALVEAKKIKVMTNAPKLFLDKTIKK